MSSNRPKSGYKLSNAFGFGLYGFVGCVIIPLLVSYASIAVRSVLPIPPGTRLPLDFLGAAVGLGTIGLISISPLWIIVGVVLGASLPRENPSPALYRRFRFLLLFGPTIGFGGLFLLASLVDTAARRVPL